MMQWLVELHSLTTVADSNVDWQVSKIRQCTVEDGLRYVNLWGSVHKSIICFISSQKLTIQKRLKVICSIRH